MRLENLRSLASILAPTIAGLIVYVVVSLFTLILQTIPILQEYLNLTEDWQASTLILTEFSKVLLLLLGTDWTNTLVLSMFWALVGLIVYFGLHGIISFVSDVSLGLHDENNVQPIGGQPRRELRRIVERSALQFVMVIVAVFYGTIVLWSFFRGDVFADTILSQFLQAHPAINALALFIGQCLALHGFTVILRLAVLRRRLFD